MKKNKALLRRNFGLLMTCTLQRWIVTGLLKLTRLFIRLTVLFLFLLRDHRANVPATIHLNWRRVLFAGS